MQYHLNTCENHNLIGYSKYGFDKDFQEVWGKFDEKNNLKGILLRYRNNFIPYIKNLEEDVSEFKDVINS